MAEASFLLYENDHPDWALPLWREALVGMDWLRLRTSKTFFGFGVPRGDGAAVVLVPGFMGHDVYLTQLYLWLWRMGYSPYMSRIGHHADCPNILIDHLLETVHRAHKATRRKVHLVGHSLGGVLSIGAAAMEPKKIGKVITMGSPLRGARVHPLVLRQADLVRNRIRTVSHRRPSHKPHHADCFTYACACGFSCRAREIDAEKLPHLAIFTKTDGVVSWKVCVTDDERRNAEVQGTHCGLAWNPEVYALIAKALQPRKRT